MPLPARLLPKLELLYGDRATEVAARIEQLLDGRCAAKAERRAVQWDERDVVLITYADQIRASTSSPLAAQREFLLRHGLDRLLSTVHLLPMFPYSSDDGFSVIDYRQVDAQSGTWDDVAALGDAFQLMFDLVLNHVSRQSAWFEAYLAGTPPYDRFFIEVDPDEDVSAVTRPRSLPLLTPVETSRGERHVWTTFSDDQIDLNFANPDVLLEMLDILVTYVENGARIIRLDAIAYLWKRLGTSCIHLPETHAVVKIFRDVVETVGRGTILLTETNVPHEENVSYLGERDEAHMVYQFSLAPLLVDAMLEGDASTLRQWLAALEPAPAGATYLNFCASHDGIGVRPLEGLVSDARLARLVDAVRERGGQVSTRRRGDGSDTPYELNITYFDAVGDPADGDVAAQIERFLTTQAVMLSLAGMPAIYFHSLVGTPNDTEGVKATGRARSINRRKHDANELESILGDPVGVQRRVFDRYQQMLATRVAQPAFHPDAGQTIVETGDDAVLAVQRTSVDGSQEILALANFGGSDRDVAVGAAYRTVNVRDLLSGDPVSVDGGKIRLPAFRAMWLVASSV